MYFALLGEGVLPENIQKSILERNKTFPDYKNNKLKKSKIWDFSKVLYQSWITNRFSV